MTHTAETPSGILSGLVFYPDYSNYPDEDYPTAQMARQLGMATNAYMSPDGVQSGTVHAVPCLLADVHYLRRLFRADDGRLVVPGRDEAEEYDIVRSEILTGAVEVSREQRVAVSGLVEVLQGRRVDFIIPDGCPPGSDEAFIMAWREILDDRDPKSPNLAVWAYQGNGVFRQSIALNTRPMVGPLHPYARAWLGSQSLGTTHIIETSHAFPPEVHSVRQTIVREASNPHRMSYRLPTASDDPADGASWRARLT